MDVNETIPFVGTLTQTAKRCGRCKKTLPLDCFHKSKTKRLGRAVWCKLCKKKYDVEWLKNVKREIPTEKQCRNCKIVKSHKEFYRNVKSRDGLQPNCKKCHNIIAEDYRKKRQAKKQAAEKPKIKINTLEQVDSVIREMAEVNLEIQTEGSRCSRRVSRIIQESAKVIAPLRGQLEHLRIGIECLMIRMHLPMGFTKRFSFGDINYNNGKLFVELNSCLAAKKLGKP